MLTIVALDHDIPESKPNGSDSSSSVIGVRKIRHPYDTAHEDIVLTNSIDSVSDHYKIKIYFWR
jgi:hypothetical protein